MAIGLLLWPVVVLAEPGDAIAVSVDQAKLVKLPARAATIVVGNPLIADVTLQNGGILVVTGKGWRRRQLFQVGDGPGRHAQQSGERQRRRGRGEQSQLRRFPRSRSPAARAGR